MSKTVPDERIVAALLQSGTVEQAAAAAGISPRTIYDRMRDDEFKVLYAHAKADILRAAVFNLTGRLSSAVDAIADIMDDKSVNAATRLQAAQTLLNNAGKYSELLQSAEKAANRAAAPADERLLEGLFD